MEDPKIQQSVPDDKISNGNNSSSQSNQDLSDNIECNEDMPPISSSILLNPIRKSIIIIKK
jgi:hypothetical protein